MKFVVEIELTDFGDTWKTETKVSHDFGKSGPEKYPRVIIKTLRDLSNEIEDRLLQHLATPHTPEPHELEDVFRS
jgi:hypothetical protein